MSDFLHKLENHMMQNGIYIKGTIKLNSNRFQRFKNADKNKSDKDIFVKIIRNCEGATYGNWCDESTWDTCWAVDFKDLTKEEKIKRKQAIEEEKRLAELHRQYAISRAEKLFNHRISKEASLEHPYAIKKRIVPFYARQIRSKLVIPIRDFKGKLQSLQSISKTHWKQFKKDCSFMKGALIMAEKPCNTYYVVEGYATGCSLFEVIGPGIVVAFNSYNLSNVALSIRANFRDSEIVICGDNDYKNKENSGLIQATKAAKESNSFLTYPIFDHLPSYKFDEIKKPSDFNDLFCMAGWEEVEKQVLENKRIV